MTNNRLEEDKTIYNAYNPFNADYFVKCAKEQIEDAKRFNLPHMLKQGEDRLEYWTNRKAEEY